MKIIAALLLMVLAGCETIDQQNQRAYMAAAQLQRVELDAAVAKCRSDWDNDARLLPIKEKLPFSIGSPTFAQLNNGAKPAASEKAAIEALDQIRESCNQSIYTLQDRTFPSERSALMRQYLADARAMLGALWGGAMTYGQYVTEAQKQFNSYIYADQQLARGLHEEYRRARAQEQQVQAARMQAWSQYMQAIKPQPIQTFIPQQQTYQTNCNQWAAGQISCTTR